MIAFCGITCTQCPAYLATQEDSDGQRTAVARLWTEQFQSEVKPGDINCDGCQAKGGRLFTFCQLCGIRKCGRDRELENCGCCDDYPCQKVSFVLDAVPGARDTLEKIRGPR